jgi:hypothetical protein
LKGTSPRQLLFAYSNEIARIAIVGDPQWERDALAFASDDLRPAPVKLFLAGELGAARAWLAG